MFKLKVKYLGSNLERKFQSLDPGRNHFFGGLLLKKSYMTFMKDMKIGWPWLQARTKLREGLWLMRSVHVKIRENVPGRGDSKNKGPGVGWVMEAGRRRGWQRSHLSLHWTSGHPRLWHREWQYWLCWSILVTPGPLYGTNLLVFFLIWYVLVKWEFSANGLIYLEPSPGLCRKQVL